MYNLMLIKSILIWKHCLLKCHLFHPPSTLRKISENFTRDMAQHSWLTLPNDPNQDIWNYYKLLWIIPIIFYDHLVIFLQALWLINLLLWTCTMFIIFLYCISPYRRFSLFCRRWVSCTLIWWWLHYYPFRTWHVNLCIHKGTHVPIQYSIVSHRKCFLVSLYAVGEWWWINQIKL